jgi:hypothetical protein
MTSRVTPTVTHGVGGKTRQITNLKALLTGAKGIANIEGIVVGARQELRGVVAPAELKLVKDGVILVQIAQLGQQVLVELDNLHGILLLADVPNLHGEVVTRCDESTAGRELDVADCRHELLEEASDIWIRVLHCYHYSITRDNSRLAAALRSEFFGFGERDEPLA